MKKYCCSDDIYKELVEDSDDNWLYGLVSFAVVEEQRIEWARHFSENNGGEPTSDQIRQWYEQQPHGVLLRAKGTAENALEAFSAEVLETALEDKAQEVENGLIVGEIRSLRAFWPQFGVNLAGGLVSAILFAALLTLIAFFVLNDTSPVDIGKSLGSNTEEATDGN